MERKGDDTKEVVGRSPWLLTIFSIAALSLGHEVMTLCDDVVRGKFIYGKNQMR